MKEPKMSRAMLRRCADRFSREPQFLGHRLAATGHSVEELAAAVLGILEKKTTVPTYGGAFQI
jgi:hypothetical protein